MKYTFFVHNSSGSPYLIRDIELPQTLSDGAGNPVVLNTPDDYKARLGSFGITVDNYQTQSISDAQLPAIYITPAAQTAPVPAHTTPVATGRFNVSLSGVTAFFQSSVGVLVILAAVAWFALHLERG